MPIEKATFRTAPPALPRVPAEPTHFWQGLVHSWRYDGKVLRLKFYDAEGQPGAVVYFTGRSEALFLTFFVRRKDHIRVEGRLTRQGRCGMSTSILDLGEEEVAERRQKAEKKAAYYKKKIALLQQGYSETAADRLIELTD
jgi:hypothetical protein